MEPASLSPLPSLPLWGWPPQPDTPEGWTRWLLNAGLHRQPRAMHARVARATLPVALAAPDLHAQAMVLDQLLHVVELPPDLRPAVGQWLLAAEHSLGIGEPSGPSQGPTAPGADVLPHRLSTIRRLLQAGPHWTFRTATLEQALADLDTLTATFDTLASTPEHVARIDGDTLIAWERRVLQTGWRIEQESPDHEALSRAWALEARLLAAILTHPAPDTRQRLLGRLGGISTDQRPLPAERRGPPRRRAEPWLEMLRHDPLVRDDARARMDLMFVLADHAPWPPVEDRTLLRLGLLAPERELREQILRLTGAAPAAEAGPTILDGLDGVGGPASATRRVAPARGPSRG